MSAESKPDPDSFSPRSGFKAVLGMGAVYAIMCALALLYLMVEFSN